MSAAEHHEVERVATVTQLPSRAMPDPEPPAIVEPRESLLRRLAAYMQPPDIWSDDRPSLRKVWLYVAYGRWTDESGLLRVLGALDSFVLVLPVFSALYTFLWLWERPARRFIAATVVALALLALKGN